MKIFRHFRILPILVLVASISLMLRVGDIVLGVEQAAGTAFAQEESHMDTPTLPDKHDTEKAEEESRGEVDASEGGHSLPELPVESKADKDVEWKDATEAEYEYSEVKAGLYKDLSARRSALESRENSMSMREALLEAAERELDQKLREMVAVRNEIESLLQDQSSEEQGRINSLVKIYEGMKAKDAARIFNTLDMDVLLSMMSRMSERKSSPILAEMSAERARAVTILLAQQKQIPSIPPQ